MRFIAVLELPPVDSARAAVRATIVEEYKDEAMRKGMLHAAGMTFGLLKPKPQPVKGGWRMSRIVDGYFKGWLCPHTHATEQEVEACKKWDTCLWRHVPHRDSDPKLGHYPIPLMGGEGGMGGSEKTDICAAQLRDVERGPDVETGRTDESRPRATGDSA